MKHVSAISRITGFAIGLTLLSACSATTPAAPFAPISSADNPTRLEEMASASTLDIGKYRPQRVIPSCGDRALPAAEAEPRLAAAIAAAERYSLEQKGYGLIVVKDGAIVHQSFAEGVDATTKTATASMAKSVLALMVGIAIERGFVGSVDDPVETYLPEWSGQARGKITLRQMLTMSSGLAPIGFQDLILAPDANARVLASQPDREPDSEFYYNNAVSQVLGSILDRQVRHHGYEGYAQFLHSDLWCPLGNGEAILWTDEQGMPRTYAGLHAGLGDWARIGELIRNRGAVEDKQIVPAAWIDEMVEPSPTNSRYGFQIWRAGEWEPTRRYNRDNPILVPHSEPFAAEDVYYFDGFGGQRVYVIPSAGLTIARTGHTNLEYDDAIIPNLLIRAVR